MGAKTLYRAGKPLRKRVRRALNGELRDELLNGEIFYRLLEAKALTERWRERYNPVRLHSALGDARRWDQRTTQLRIHFVPKDKRATVESIPFEF